MTACGWQRWFDRIVLMSFGASELARADLEVRGVSPEALVWQ